LRRLEDDIIMTRHLRVSVDGKAYDVVVEELASDADAPPHQPSAPPAPRAAEPAPAPAPVAAPAPAPSAPVAKAAAPGSGGPDDRVAPLSGVVVEIHVAVGDVVAVDQPVAVLEAMKMKSVIGAHKAGRITAIYVEAGDGVEADQPMMTIA
jgi:glutaconyl-CoA/methylmalonyl-CoA decarboxylase subunit gamma